MISELIVKNPFRLLGLPVNAKLSDINNNLNKSIWNDRKWNWSKKYNVDILSVCHLKEGTDKKNNNNEDDGNDNNEFLSMIFFFFV